MVSEQFESMDLDMSLQGGDFAMKKTVVPLKTIVYDFQQQIQNQMEIFSQFLNQKLDELKIENAKTHAVIREALNLREEVRYSVSKPIVSYTAPPMKPVHSPEGEIECEDSIEAKSGINIPLSIKLDSLRQLQIECGGSTLNGEESYGKILTSTTKMSW